MRDSRGGGAVLPVSTGVLGGGGGGKKPPSRRRGGKTFSITGERNVSLIDLQGKGEPLMVERKRRTTIVLLGRGSSYIRIKEE